MMPNHSAPPVSGIAIVDDSDFVRAGIEAILLRAGRGPVCGLGENERDARHIVETLCPRILILDLFLGYRDGILLIKDLAAAHPETKMLALSDYADSGYAERAMCAGAQGFLPKGATVEHLLAAVDSIQMGKPYLPRPYEVLLTGKPASRGTANEIGIDALTDRELHVFQLEGVGLGTGEIAKQLGLSRKTIESYKDHIKQKLECGNAAGLKEKAIEWMAQVTGMPQRFAFRDNAETGDVPRYSRSIV